MDATEKNPRWAGNVRANAAFERRRLKQAYFGIAPPDPLPIPDEPIPLASPPVPGAETEARRRFAEFADSLELRDPTDAFAAKATFRDDFGLEHLWFRVWRSDGEHLYGTLETAPRNLRALKPGQAVIVPVNRVEDWLIFTDGTTLGGFTLARREELRRAGVAEGDRRSTRG